MAKQSREARNNKIIKWMWRGLALFFIALLFVFFLIYNGFIGYMPPVAQLRNPTDNFASTMETRDHVPMGKVFQSKGNRYFAEFKELPENLKNALIATEDERYRDHSGIDATAIGRSVIKRIILGQKEAGGGSTITQQLAKQLYSPTSKNIFERALQKPIEWVIAMKLERYFTKDEIMQMYFNQFDFLNNAVGIKSAAYVYFGKESPKDLNLQEAALLVAMCKNPSYYNPRRYRERAMRRRNFVLEKMAQAGFISQTECDIAKKSDIDLSNYHVVTQSGGIAPYVREEIKRIMMAKRPVYSDYPMWNKQAFFDDSIQWVDNPLYGWCNKNRKADGTPYNIYTDGLQIITTIDSRMQEYAEKAAEEHLRKLQGGFCSRPGRDPYANSGLPKSVQKRLLMNTIRNSARYRALKAQGLSEDQIMENFKKPQRLTGIYDPINGDSTKQSTMTISPLDSLKFAKNILRCGMMSMDAATGEVRAYVGGPDFNHFSYDMVSVGRRQIGSTMKPYLYSLAMECGYNPCDQISNARVNINGWSPRGGGGGGMLTLKQALTSSNNTCAARLVDLLKVTNLITMLHNFGLTNQFDTVAPLCLGSCEISVKQQVSGYSVFANKGIRSDPMFVKCIKDRYGNTIAEFSPRQKEVISERSSYCMVDMLKNVIANGTGKSATGYVGSIEMGGKTGTTNDNMDGWFMGFTPQLVTGVWVGGEERYIHYNGVGATQALPIWGLYMKKVINDPELNLRYGYSADAKFGIPDDFDYCERPKGMSSRSSDVTGGGGVRRSGGGAAAQGGGAKAVRREDPHPAEAMQGAFD